MTKVVIVGAGKGGRALLEMIVGDPTVSIVGVADANAWAPGLELARRLNIPVATDFRPLVQDPRVDLIIDVTGNPPVAGATIDSSGIMARISACARSRRLRPTLKILAAW